MRSLVWHHLWFGIEQRPLWFLIVLLRLRLRLPPGGLWGWACGMALGPAIAFRRRMVVGEGMLRVGALGTMLIIWTCVVVGLANGVECIRRWVESRHEEWRWAKSSWSESLAGFSECGRSVKMKCEVESKKSFTIALTGNTS